MEEEEEERKKWNDRRETDYQSGQWVILQRQKEFAVTDLFISGQIGGWCLFFNWKKHFPDILAYIFLGTFLGNVAK